MKNGQIVPALCLLTLATGSVLAEPDLIVSHITSATTFGSVDGKIAYSFGTTICNIGDTDAAWVDGTNQNPLISQTLYRLADGQIQQLGIGFAHYATAPLSGNACALGCTPAGFSALGPGCSTTSSSAIHGSQGSLGPRTEVNPFTADYPYPFTSIGQTGDAIYKRLQVNIADISDPNALYFVESQVIASAETSPATKANNVSYRQVTFAPGSANATVVGPTYTEQPAIFAWRDHGNGIGMPDTEVMITETTIPHSEEHFVIGSRATNLGTNHWRYTYAIYNMNGQRSIRDVFVGLPEAKNRVVDSIEFYSPSYHDDIDEQIVNTPWSATAEYDMQWKTDTYAQNPLANAIRWGTMYHFAFELEHPWTYPGNQGVLIGFFGPNEPDDLIYIFEAITPLTGIPVLCAPDLNGDGQLNFFDVSQFLGEYSAGADYNYDGVTNFFDVSAFLADYIAGCP